jgi:2-oxoglutarate dehydrogenase E2 component (dihydrolipoamide succinyltransferase)
MSDATEVLMPSMGEGITEATLVKWLKQPGDAIQKTEALLEVSTDKVDTEIPAPASGFLVQTFAKDGEMIQINAVIATIAGSADAKVEAPKAKKAEKAAPGGQRLAGSPGQDEGLNEGRNADEAAASRHGQASRGDAAPHLENRPGASMAPPRAPGEAVRSSPLVRKMARSEGIDLGQIAGSGLKGRITKRDLEHWTGGGSASRPVAGHAPVYAPPQPATLERLETRQSGGQELLDGVAVRREKMSKMRSLIAEHMVRSVRTSPHVTTVFEIDVHKIVALREKQKKAFAAKEGFNLTYTPFFVHAAAQAIKQHPIVNVSVDGTDILWKDEINIGVAVAIETGLIVPVIRNAGELNLLGIARRLNDLATRARSKKLLPEDVQGGTFSITNPGMFGSVVSAPIINQPQVAILSLGAIVKRPVVIDDLIGIRPLVQIGLTFDHRVVDGEGGAKYLATLKKLLETFDEPVI